MYTIPKKLLSNGNTNAKTKKNDLKTFILYLSPYNQNSKGVNICPKASKGCAASCLFSAGRGAFNSVKNSRINKTEYFLANKAQFIKQLAKEITTKHKTAVKTGAKVAFRLNGTSHLDFIYLLKKYANLDVETLSNAVFYDYTKILGKVKKYIDHKNYFLTFSRAEDNQKETLEALKLGANVSAVFLGDLPKRYKGFKVVNGDKSDDLMINVKNSILGLSAKVQQKRIKAAL